MKHKFVSVAVIFLILVLLSVVVLNGRGILFYFHLKSKEVPVSFYGQVLDQYGQPVDDAQVKMSLCRASFRATWAADWVTRLIVTTDKDGLFAIENRRGWQLSVGPITKDGYQYTRFERHEHNAPYPYGSFYVGAHLPDKAKPVIYHLHKVDATSYLLKGEDRLTMHTDGKPQVGEIARDPLYFNPRYYLDRRDNSQHFPGFSVSASISDQTHD